MRKGNKIRDGLKLYSESEINEIEKSGERVNIIDLSPQEIAALQENEFQMEVRKMTVTYVKKLQQDCAQWIFRGAA